MSYPPPPGPDGSRPQGRPYPGWQPQPYGRQPQRQQPYHPGGTDPGQNWGGSGDGGPPKNRAGLVIILTLVFLIAILAIGGVIGFGLVSSKDSADPSPGPQTSSAPAAEPTPTPTLTSKPVPTTTAPSRPPTTGGSTARATALAQQFVTHLNANKTDAAVALACEDSKQFLPFLIKGFVEPPTSLTVGTAIGQSTSIVPVMGTTKGGQASGIILVQAAGNSYCIKAFQLTPK